MKTSTKDRIQGKFHEVKGKVREKAGQVVNDSDLKAKGHSENVAGKIQKKIGQIRGVFEQ